MITPPFQVTQDEEFIYIHMKIKYIKVRYEANSGPLNPLLLP
jgi:hypothetical protein